MSEYPDFDNLPDWVTPGISYRINGKKYHVRGIIDGQAVVCWWSRERLRWRYFVEGPEWFASAWHLFTDIKPSGDHWSTPND